MDFLSKIFGKKKSNDDLPGNVRDALFRLTSILNDDEKQNALMPDDFQKKCLVDGEIDISIGNNIDFGRTPHLAIPVNGPLGELTYLSRLQTATGSRFFFHRLGSIKYESRNIDVFEIVSWNGALFDILYFDYYHNKKIEIAPSGYSFANRVEGLTGINQYIDKFPQNIYEATQALAKKILGAPLANPLMRHVDTSKIKRPLEFGKKITQVIEDINDGNGVQSTRSRNTFSSMEHGRNQKHDINLDEFSEEFASCWNAAMQHIENQAQGKLFWLKARLHPPFLEHLSFRLGNQLFFVRIEDADDNLATPGSHDGLIRIAKGSNGQACILPMKKRAGNWGAAETDWGLIHAISRKPIDPVMLISDEDIEMSEWELYDFAVQIVRNNLQGRQIMSWSSDPEVTPSIWFAGENGPEWVLVKAVKYPELDADLPHNIDEIFLRCSKIANKGNLAVVGIASSDEESNKTGVPLPLLRGYGLVARYQGLRDIKIEDIKGTKEKKIEHRYP